MRSLSKMLRLLPLSAAALASIATSAPPGVYVSEVTPPEGETAVPVDVLPEIRVVFEDGSTPPLEHVISLWHADGTPVPGAGVRLDPGGQDMIYRFVPDAPLPLDDYRLHLDEIPGDSDGFGVDAMDVAFSTISRPTVLSSALYRDGWTGWIRFSQPMPQDSLEAHLVVRDRDGNPVPRTLQLSQDGHYVDIILEGARPETLWLEAGLVAVDGTPMGGLPMTLTAY